MAIETTYSAARANLASLLNQVSDDRETVIIRRRGAEDVALVSAAELSSLQETAHLLRSPANARRLLAALNRAMTNRATTRELRSQTVDWLRQEIGLGQEK